MSDIMGPTLNRPASTGVNYNAISDPASWATTLLQVMGYPITDSNVNFLVSWAAIEGGNWNNTAAYNPLNTTLQVPGSSVMSGGNTAGVQAYQSWQQGIQATATTLAGYPLITAALQSGDAWAVNQSGQLGGDLSKWSNGGYTSIGQNTAYGATSTRGAGGGAVGTAAAPVGGAAAGAPPGLNDIPALDAYIRQNFGTDSWLLDIPSVKDVLEKAVAQGYDNAQIQAQIQQTEWWQTTSQAVKNYEQSKANNPADYQFTTPGSIAAQTLAQIMSTAAQAGVQLDPTTAQTLAQNAMQYGWTSQQIQQAIGSSVTYNGQTGNAGTVVQQLQAMAAQYYMTPTPQVLQSWAQNIAGGTQTMQQFQAQMQQDATMKWTGFAPQLAQGKTMQQLTDSYRAEAAKLMEVDPNSINFQTDPFYSKILDYVPPNSSNGVHRVMTLSEMDQYLRGSSQWAGTQQARDTGAQIEQAILGAFGKVAA